MFGDPYLSRASIVLGYYEMSPMMREPPIPEPPRNEPPLEAPRNELQTENVPPKRGWCSPWKWGIFLAIVLILMIIAPFVVVHPFRSDENPNNPDLVLEELAAYYKKTLDENVEPCENFYSFVCSNLMSEYEKENQYRFDTLKKMEKSARLSLDDLLTKPLNASDSPLLRQLKTFHQACINTTKIEEEGIEPVLDLLKEIGGWPLLSNDWNSTESWMDIVGSLNRVEFPYSLTFQRGPHDSPGAIMMLAPLLIISRPRVLTDGNRTVEYMKRVARLLNATNDRLDDDIKDCITFESDLWEVTKPMMIPDREGPTIESLTKIYTEIPWKSFFRNIFVSTRTQVSDDEPMLLFHEKYNFRVSLFLNRTSTKAIRNYIVWRLIEQAIPVMPEKFRDAKSAFEQRTFEQTRNGDCLDILISRAKVSVGHLYIKNFFDRQAKNKSQSMIKSIESQAYRFLNNMTWMDSKTNTRLIERLRKSDITLPHPTDTLDEMEVLEFQSNDTTFANYRRLLGSHRNFKYNKLRLSQEVDRQPFPLNAMKVDGYFFPSFDVTFMLTAILQRPFFDVEQPMYLNYGGIGFTLAHVMTHRLQILSACDHMGCPSYELFRERRTCFENLYGKHPVKQLNETVDGRNTVEENIGDLIGLKLAYRAYEEFAKDSEEQLLPGFNYTRRQWFWINTATTLCSYESDESLRDSIAASEHSPAEVRVNVAFANIKEFSRDFECSPDSGIVNSTNRCEFE